MADEKKQVDKQTCDEAVKTGQGLVDEQMCEEARETGKGKQKKQLLWLRSKMQQFQICQ